MNNTDTTPYSTLESQERQTICDLSDVRSQPECMSTVINDDTNEGVLRELTIQNTLEESVPEMSSSDTSHTVVQNDTDSICRQQQQSSQPLPSAAKVVDGVKDLEETVENGSVQGGCISAVGNQQELDSLSAGLTGDEQQLQDNNVAGSPADTQTAEQSQANAIGLSHNDPQSEPDEAQDVTAVSKNDDATGLAADNHQMSEASSTHDAIPAIVIDTPHQTTSRLHKAHGDFDDTYLGICGWKDHPIPNVNHHHHHHHHHHHQHDATCGGDAVDSVDDDKCYSTEDESSDWETPVDVELDVTPAADTQRSSKVSWCTVKAITKWMPMAHAKLQWTQLAGHKDSFLAGREGTVFKLLTSTDEERNLKILMVEKYLRSHVPVYHGTVKKEGKNYIELQDLLHGFGNSHCVMDIKMGIRTYQEEELAKAKSKPTLRKDLYQKMVSIDPSAPTEEEKKDQAILKPRYMKFRDDMSSTSSLGFRIEGTKTGSSASKDYKDTRTAEQVQDAIAAFVEDNIKVLEKYIVKMQNLHKAQQSSPFFVNHEIVGSSLLFVHDKSGKVGLWMIDFAKCSHLPPSVSITHSSPWIPGNYEDGYWMGLDNLISIFQDLLCSLQNKKK